MKLCRVLGTLVATEKHRALEGHTLLHCQPLDEFGKPAGDSLVAADHAQAGVGDTVLVNQEGNGARQIFGTVDGTLPIRSVIVGVVDTIERSG